jgi:hypothetical protein
MPVPVLNACSSHSSENEQGEQHIRQPTGIATSFTVHCVIQASHQHVSSQSIVVRQFGACQLVSQEASYWRYSRRQHKRQKHQARLVERVRHRHMHCTLVCLLKELQHCYELPSRDCRRDSSWFGPLVPAKRQSQVSGGTLEAAVSEAGVALGAQPKLPFGAGVQMLFESFGAWHDCGAVPDVLQHGGSEKLVSGSWWQALQRPAVKERKKEMAHQP